MFIAGSVLFYGLLMYLFLARRFPNEDPRIASSRYSLRQQLFFMSATALVFVALFFVTRYLGWIDVFRYLSLILGMVYLFANRHLNKRYWPAWCKRATAKNW